MDPAADLINYREQVAAIDIALQTDPDNAELVSLKTELLELITLTEALIQQEPAASVPAPATPSATTTYHDLSTQRPPKPSAAQSQPIYQPPAPIRTWSVGDRCRALFAEDGKYYEATVMGVGAGADGQVYSVEFKGYADSPPVTLGPHDLKPTQDPKKYHKTQPAISNSTQTTADADKGQRKRAAGEVDGAGTKKKKSNSAASEQVQKQMAWQNFAKGGAKKSKSGGILKKSIFATPDNPEGKVGVVGSGKGMTQFQQRGKHIYDSSTPGNP